MAYHVYIALCADDTLYVGCTNDLERRFREHNHSPAGARYTKARRPVVLKYSERFETVGDALRREYEIKTWKRERKLRLIKEAEN